MVDFSKKILGVAAAVVLFAGVSQAQTVTCAGPNTQVNIVAGVGTTPPISGAPFLLRGEGTTELVSDPYLQNCEVTGTTTTGSVTVFASAPVTSKVINTTTGQTEATLLITTAGGVTTAYPATSVSGTVVTFGNVAFPANPTVFSLEVTDIRVNASSLAIGPTPVPVTETIFGGFNGQATIATTAITVGEALQSLVAPAFVPTTLNSSTVCAGNPATATQLPATNFTVQIAESLGGFFKQGPGATTLITTPPTSEYGTWLTTTGTFTAGNGATFTGAGIPTTGTRIQLSIANVPSVATVYLPLTVTSGAGVLTLTTGGPTGGFSAATAATSPASLVGNNLVAFTPSSGTVTAIYEVTTADPSAIDKYSVPVKVSFAANTASPQTTPITVLESYAPTGSTNIPNFAVSSNTPLNGSVITACVTNILFPFLTNQVGYDTGIAIANTGTDPFGTKSAATGTCTLNFYGNGAPTPASLTTASIAPGSVDAFVLSGVAPGFQGYMIAQCPFLYGHGFAYVTNAATAGSSGVAQGYIGLILGGVTPARTTGIESLGE